MPESHFAEYFPTLKVFISSVIGAVIGVVTFITKLQTKNGCKKSHKDHDLLMAARDETREEEKQHFQTKLNDIHDDVKELAKSQKAFVKKITDDFYSPNIHSSD